MQRPEKFSETYYLIICDEVVERQKEIDKKSKENMKRIIKKYEKRLKKFEEIGVLNIK